MHTVQINLNVSVTFKDILQTFNYFSFVLSAWKQSTETCLWRMRWRSLGKNSKNMYEKFAGGEVQVAVGSRGYFATTAHVHYLLNLLVDNRYLNIDEIDSVISYLNERRKRLEEKRGTSACTFIIQYIVFFYCTNMIIFKYNLRHKQLHSKYSQQVKCEFFELEG